MKASENCFDVIKHFERCKLRSYPDPKTGGAPWTIGWGHTNGISPGVVWTQVQADAYLLADVSAVESDVNTAVRVPMAQGQFDAFVSALFNIGHGSPIRDGLIRLRTGYSSTFLTKLNAGDYAGAREQLGKWISPGSAVEHGLHRRRTAEQALWDGLPSAEAIALGDAA